MEKIIIRNADNKDLARVLHLNLELVRKEYREYDKSLSLKWTYGMQGKNISENEYTDATVSQSLLNIMGILSAILPEDRIIGAPDKKTTMLC